jgi:hypothetical protein
MATNVISFRLSAEELESINFFLSAFMRRTGTNYTMSKLIRRSLAICLKRHKAELEAA